jgi:trans-aconitate methyltransferase
MLQLMEQMGVSKERVSDVVDLGCATGLSTLALQEILPQANFTGVDLSPHFLAVGRYNQQQREVSSITGTAIVGQHGVTSICDVNVGHHCRVF